MKDNKKSKTLAKKPEAPKFKIGQEVFFPVSGSPEKWIIQQSKIVGLTYEFIDKTGEIVHTGYTMASNASNESSTKANVVYATLEECKKGLSELRKEIDKKSEEVCECTCHSLGDLLSKIGEKLKSED
jgi:hypothetical protein